MESRGREVVVMGSDEASVSLMGDCSIGQRVTCDMAT